ncbi:MAG: hypothetical protein Kow0026_10750 [Oricola sp.]
MLARLPWVKPLRIEPERRRRLTKDRKAAIREKVVPLARTAEPTPFAIEGPARHGIRAALCLQGWRWAEADAIAAEIVAAALNIVGAKRPTWEQGQPEWTQPGALPILRERCIRCRKPLPEGHYKFCSKMCGDAYHGERNAVRLREERHLKRMARLAAWSAKQPEQRCEGCGGLFRPRRPGQRFCCTQCVGRIYGGKRARIET